MYIKEIDQRTHKKGGDNCSYAGNGRQCGNIAACNYVQGASESYTDKVCGDPDKFKPSEMPFVCEDERYRVVGGNAHVRGKIKCGAEAHKHNADEQEQNAQGHGGVWENALQDIK